MLRDRGNNEKVVSPVFETSSITSFSRVIEKKRIILFSLPLRKHSFFRSLLPKKIKFKLVDARNWPIQQLFAQLLEE